MLCLMDDIVIEKFMEESISSANEDATRMQDKYPLKQVRFIDKVEKTKKKLIMDGNSKSRMSSIDGQCFYTFTSRTCIGDYGPSCFITDDPTGICDAESINESIRATNGLIKVPVNVLV